MPNLQQDIIQGLQALELNCTDEQVEKFAHYLQLLHKWNKSFNLTSIRNIDAMLERHLLDSLSIVPFLEGERFIDIGTGPGLPGIPLAIFWPEKNFTLLDSNGKKTRFLLQVKQELGLENIEVIHSRSEAYSNNEKFDGVLSRAFAELDKMLQVTEHLCKADGYFYAMKGLVPEQSQLQALTKPYKVQPIHWQFNDAERHLIIIKQN